MNTLQALKQQEIISVRDFVRNMSKINARPKKKVYTVVKNGQKVGTYIPAEYEEEFCGLNFRMEEGEKKYKDIFDNYENMVIEGGDPQLSQKIDQILYGKK